MKPRRRRPFTTWLLLALGQRGSSAAAHWAKKGQRVILLEAIDFAAGASGNSTGWAHAGIRYLQREIDFSKPLEAFQKIAGRSQGDGPFLFSKRLLDECPGQKLARWL